VLVPLAASCVRFLNWVFFPWFSRANLSYHLKQAQQVRPAAAAGWNCNFFCAKLRDETPQIHRLAVNYAGII
jgi:hypothetical protein